MKIAVIGIGTVGEAVYQSFVKKCTDCDIHPYDKYKKIGSFENVIESEIMFLCLPTPYSYEKKKYDKSSIQDVCEKLSNVNYQGLVVIKSTVEPGTSQNIAEKYNISVVHNPEFLSAKSAFEDFHDQSHIVIGTTSKSSKEMVNNLKYFYKKYYANADFSFCTSTESESMKIFCNNFYAVKIQFFNELYLLCKSLGTNYDVVVKMMLKNKWINPMHTSVPGTDGKLSYGGMCFPKDTNALLSFMKSSGIPSQVLEATIKERELMRNKTEQLHYNFL